MRYLRKGLAVLISAALLSVLPINVHAQPNIIHESKSSQIITSGVTLENITRFTSDGWLNINVIRINLGDPYVKIDAITSNESIGKLASTISLARASGAAAAVNASFFTPLGDGRGEPLGPVVKSGSIISASSSFNSYQDSMATFSMDDLKKVFFDYWKIKITLLTPSGVSIPANQYNLPSGQKYNDITIIDRKYSIVTPGSSEKYPDMVEIIVDSGKVIEVRQGQPSSSIPANGYAIISRGSKGQDLLSRFKAGDPVAMSISTTPDWEKLKLAVSGGSILVKDGKIPSSFSFDPSDISKRNPRTVIGSSKDGKQLILLTVDGRQNSSIGLTQTETAELMQELGAWNALNMDGGGSTTMVARKQGESTLSVVNKPSESTRSVSTALGIFSIAPVGPLAGIIVESDDNNVFVNTSRKFTVKGYDRYFNPVEVKPEQVKWSVSGIKGVFTGNSLKPTTVGEGTVTATVGKIKGSLPISSLSSPVSLSLSSSALKMSVGQTKTFTVIGYNKNGYSAKIYPEDIKWTVSSKSGTVTNGVFKAVSGGTGYIDASVGKVHSYCTYSITTETTSLLDNFEKANGTFVSYPETVGGAYQLVNDTYHSGKASGKLSYDFTNTEGTRAAYLAYPDKGILLPSGTHKLGLWVFNTHENSNWVRAEIYDSSGVKRTAEFANSMDWIGWKYLEASLENISTPAYLARLYVVQIHPVSDSGSVYFDDLSCMVSGFPAIDAAKIPKNTVPVDEANKAVTFVKGTNNFRFAVFGSDRDPKNPLEKLLNAKMRDKINKYVDAAVYTGAKAAETAAGLTTPFVATGTGYKSVDYKNSRFIQLDMSKGGLRTSDSAQWTWFYDQLATAKGSNVFIALSGSPDNFADSLEAKLFKDTLAEYRKTSKKNVWVFYKGSVNGSQLERGVRYISCAGLDVEGLAPDKTDPAKYVLVNVIGSTVTFEIKTII